MNEKADTLLDIAKTNLYAAKTLIQIADDERMINMVAYHLQQSIELALKHYIETQLGKEYPFTHDINELLSVAGEDDFPELYPWGGTITLMESKTRYIKNFRQSVRIVNDVMELSDNLIKQIEDKEKEEEQEVDR